MMINRIPDDAAICTNLRSITKTKRLPITPPDIDNTISINRMAYTNRFVI